MLAPVPVIGTEGDANAGDVQSLIPESFRLTVRQIRTEEGYQDDPVAVKQLAVIRGLLDRAGTVITATEMSREGELVARYLYEYLGFKGEANRLRLTALTDEAIWNSLRDLRPGSEYDNLYLAGKARREADWIIGYGASKALGIAAGKGNYSLGRVQTPVLALVCGRFLENRDYQPSVRYRLELTVIKDGKEITLSSGNDYEKEEEATAFKEKMLALRKAIVLQAAKEERNEETPLLYDLVSLQKDACAFAGLTARQTLVAARQLYEKGYLSFPRTSCRYVGREMLREMPYLLSALKQNPRFARHAETLESGPFESRSMDNSRLTGHHALLITRNTPEKLSPDEQIVYSLVAGRMLEAFSTKCVREFTAVRMECAGVIFQEEYARTIENGWKAVYDRGVNDERELPVFLISREELPIAGIEVRAVRSSPPPVFTEISLLEAMESTGTSRYGLGTPSTRADVIELLISRRYVERQGKYLLPTPKGLEVYGIVKDKRIAGADMTAEWEYAFQQIEKEELDAEEFMKEARSYARQMVSELLEIKLSHPELLHCRCPKCGGETITVYRKVARCSDPDCAFHLFRCFNGRELTDEQILRLLQGKRTSYLEFTSKRGKTYEASLKMDDNYRIELKFKDNRPDRNG